MRHLWRTDHISKENYAPADSQYLAAKKTIPALSEYKTMIRLGGKDWIDILWACQSRLLSCLTMLSAQPSDLVGAKVHCRAPRQGLSCSFLLCFSNLRSCPVHKSQESCRVMQVESLRFFQDCRIRQSWLLQGSHRPSKQCGVVLAIKQSQEKKNPENTLHRTLVLSV